MGNRLISAVRVIPRRWLGLAAAAVVLVVGGAVIGGYSIAQTSSRTTEFPQSAAMEDQFGIRFSRVAVVGDGGLITLSYVVLDGEKAFRFQSDTKHPPELISESRSESTTRVSIMKQGHLLRPGQTYYLVYQNTHAALQPGEWATIVQGDVQLPHVPVL